MLLALNLIFTVLVIATCIPAIAWGGWEGRQTCAMLIGTGIVTGISTFLFRTASLLPAATFTLDLALAGGLLRVALRTDRYWPIWIFALHALSLLTFVAWLIVPGQPPLFRAVAGFWSIPELLILCIGPSLDHAFILRAERSHGRADSIAECDRGRAQSN